MKKTNITIPVEDEKLKALRLFAGKKDADIEAELDDAVQKLYEKYVPKDARELLDLMAAQPDAVSKVKSADKKPAATKPSTPKLDAVKDSQVGPGSNVGAGAHPGNTSTAEQNKA